MIAYCVCVQLTYRVERLINTTTFLKYLVAKNMVTITILTFKFWLYVNCFVEYDSVREIQEKSMHKIIILIPNFFVTNYVYNGIIRH